MLLDHLAIDQESEEWVVRDHKFTWRNDARVAARMLYSDQLLLYAATWNKLVDYWKWHEGVLVNVDGSTTNLGWPDLPRVGMVVTNVVVVNAKGKHIAMPAESRLVTREHEHYFWERTLREQAMANAFEIQATHNGWPYARQFMRPAQCLVFSACPFIASCHQGVDPSNRDVYEQDPDLASEGVEEGE
jgi:hypothetical protein